jgi:hypothetical protein
MKPHAQVHLLSAAPAEIEKIDEYEAAEEFSPEVARCKQIVEPGVSQKVADDYAAVVWAYGVIWSLFAIYGIILWVRSKSLQRDLLDLRRQIDGGSSAA